MSSPSTIASGPREVHPQDPHWDPRWELVQRILLSSVFARSEQLSKLLSYVCRMAILERLEVINEHDIGVAVFGRPEGYDSTADSIVRSHATRLRQRLEMYFRGPGREETLRIEIPRGGYVPRFYAASAQAASTPQAEPLEPADEPQTEPAPMTPVSPATSRLIPSRRAIAILSVLLTLAFGTMLMLLLRHLHHDAEMAVGRAGIQQTPQEQRFWDTLMPTNGRTLIVTGDAGLILYETVTNHEVSLEDYIGGTYRSTDYIQQLHSEATPQLTKDLAERRYTSIIDEELAEGLTHLPQWTPTHVSSVFAQDLKPSDTSGANLILLGSRQSDPWVSLIEPALNFVLIPDGKRGFQFLNRNPLPGEPKIYGYQFHPGDTGEGDIYANIAYLPNPAGKGMVLLLSGMWSPGTQAAGRFLLDSARISAFLKSIANPDGTIPPFELLLETRSLQGNATHTTIAAKRVHGRAS